METIKQLEIAQDAVKATDRSMSPVLHLSCGGENDRGFDEAPSNPDHTVLAELDLAGELVNNLYFWDAIHSFILHDSDWEVTPPNTQGWYNLAPVMELGTMEVFSEERTAIGPVIIVRVGK